MAERVWVSREVAAIGDGSTIEKAHRPDLPEDAEFRLLEDRGDRMFVEVLEELPTATSAE